jgi:dihydrofolate synthase/folylpolyglutamate synthase
MTYVEAIDFLYSLRLFGAKFGLSNTLKLAGLAGHPERRLRFIHVAGTNGKGSTCAILESIYRAAGLRVGLFTSPHLVAFGERIQVNRQPITETEVCRLVEETRPWMSQFSPPEHPTFFEAVTIMALRHFGACGCDLVIWETGLGGRLDATNIVTPLASVITNIQYDHQKWLGETLPAIAAEKAGIIKPNLPVLTATEAPDALAVITETARKNSAPLTVVTPAEIGRPPLDTIELPLLGRHQQLNAALAVATVRVLEPQIPVPETALRQGLATVYWPGRLQLLTLASGQKVLFDGAHNVGGAETMAVALREFFPNTEPTLILGILSDKDWERMCQILAPLARRIVLVAIHSERATQPGDLAAACRRANPAATVMEAQSLREALACLARDPFLVFAGSLYLIGEAMELLQLPATGARDERGLNEWGAPKTPNS